MNRSNISHMFRSAFAVALLSVVIAQPVFGQAVSIPASYSRTSSFEYDPTTGLVRSETVEPDNPQQCVKTTYSYDDYGNRTGSTTSNCDGAKDRARFDTRTANTTYNAGSVTLPDQRTLAVPAGAFVDSLQNALSQRETRLYDVRFGTQVQVIGPNTLATRWEYDFLGRVVKELRADGTSTVTRYCYLDGRGLSSVASNDGATCRLADASEVLDDAISYVESEIRDTSGNKAGPASRTYVDRAGRKLRTVTEGFDGSTQKGGSLIVQDTEYDYTGAVVITTEPYFLGKDSSTSGGGKYGMTATTYDDVGRPGVVYHTDSSGSQQGVPFGTRGTRIAAQMMFQYSALKTIVTDDQGHTRTEERNIDGKVARITDATGAQLTHFYDAFGNLTKSRNALGHDVVVTYDTRGRKLSMSDPNTGIWEYDYNALGELVWQRNPNQLAKNQETTLSYDLLGRLVKRIEPEFTSKWYYDQYADGSACAKGVGKLCESVTDNGVRRRVQYDSFARPKSTRTDIANGPSFASAVSYDNNTGRPMTQTYPTGVTVRYNFSGLGYLSSMTLDTVATLTPMATTTGSSGGAPVPLPAGTMLWQGLSYNAWGKIEEQQLGNDVRTLTSYEDESGHIKRITAGLGDKTNIVDYGYQWNALGQLTVRTDSNGDGTTGAVTDTFTNYDEVGRLQSYSVAAPQVPNLNRIVSFQYNALGSVLYNSDVGIYTYPEKDQPHPQQLQSVADGQNTTFTYDANGNLTMSSGGKYRSIAYTSFNLPDNDKGVGSGGGPEYHWIYDEAHQRIKETHIDGDGTRTTWMMHPDASNGLSFESEESHGDTNNRHYLSAGGDVIGVLISRGAMPQLTSSQLVPNALQSINLTKVEYWHKDSLGSLVATTDHSGSVTARYSYDPFGKRRTVSGNYDTNGSLTYDWNTTSGGTDRGYTGHEQLDDVGIIHMNGRLYDPRLGVFMQGDPFIQDPSNLQNFNRYAYCYNNPLTCTDPTGQLSLFGHKILPGLFNNKNIRIVASIAAAYYLGPASSLWSEGGALAGLGIESGFAQSAIAGFASGSIASGSLKGGLQGAFSASLFYGAGNIAAGGDFWSAPAVADKVSWEAGVALHGVTGCVTSTVGGGSCGAGALSSAFTKGITSSNIAANMIAESGGLGRIAILSTIGGTASVLGGGKFANGAVTAAYSYAFNCLGHPETCAGMFTKAGAGIGAGVGAVSGMGLSVACDVATSGGCAPINPGIVAISAGEGAIGGAVAGAAVGGTVDSVVKRINGNSWLSPNPTSVYVLYSIEDGSVLKFGITDEVNEVNRYSAREYAQMRATMDVIARFESRAPARMLEISLCMGYVATHGSLPPASKKC